MDFLGFMIAFVGAIGLIVGLISILYPIRYLFIYNRLMALAVVVVSIMLVNAGSEMSPKIAAENAVKDAQSASDRQRAAFERAHAERVAKDSRQSGSSSKTWLRSESGCRSDRDGNTTCAYRSSADLGIFGTSTTTSRTKCGTNLVSGAYECKSETSSD